MRLALNKELPKIVARKSRWMLAFLRHELIGIAEDFWKDGGAEEKPLRQYGARFSNPLPPVVEDERRWHAEPGEVAEKMWGEGNVFPGDTQLAELLIQPFNLTRDMTVLDLSAGLGSRMRRIHQEFKAEASGREADAKIAFRGAAIIAEGLGKGASITPYDPMNLVESNRYDCIVMREALYAAADKEKFIKSIEACCKEEAQVSFTDYIVNPEYKNEPTIVAWQKREFGAEPVSLVEMAELWARAGFSLRVHDDQTDFYKQEIKRGLLRLAQFMVSGVKPDVETKVAIEKQLTLWALRMAALEKGMKFYRFYGLK